MPKRQAFDVVVPGRPEEVAARLTAATRLRPFPSQGSWFGGRKPLGGRVRPTGFRLALDPFDPWTRLQAVAVGEIVDEGGGRTRVRGTAGLPTGLTWYLRFADLVIAAMGVGLLVGGLAGGPAEMLAAGLMTVFLAVLGVFAIGFHVANADGQVAALADEVTRRAVGGADAVGEPAATRESGESRETAAPPRGARSTGREAT